MEKEIKYKGKVITKKHPSGMFEYYSDKQKRFLKFDTLDAAKGSIDKEGKKEEIKESIKPKTKKIKLSEVRQLVRKMIKEESMNPKSFGVGSFGVTKDVDLGEKPFEDLDSSLKNTDNLLKRVSKLCDKFSISYSGGDGDFEKKVVMQIMRKVRNDINKVSDKLIEDVIFYMEDRYDF